MVQKGSLGMYFKFTTHFEYLFQDIDMNRKGGVIIFFYPLKGGRNFVRARQGGVENFWGGQAEKMPAPPTRNQWTLP